MKKKNKHKLKSTVITQNKRSRYEYFIEQEFEAGLSLHGWEVKSIRSGKANISDSYVILKNREAYLVGAMFQPLTTASSHLVCDPIRSRKILLNKRELYFLLSQVNRKGYTILALSLYWKNTWIKVRIGIAKGKKEHDKRILIKDREWQLDKARIIKHSIR